MTVRESCPLTVIVFLRHALMNNCQRIKIEYYRSGKALIAFQINNCKNRVSKSANLGRGFGGNHFFARKWFPPRNSPDALK